MKKEIITRAGTSIELCEYLDDFYLISEMANKTLDELRSGLSTWISAEIYRKMNLSIWVYSDTRVNAFCYYKDEKNYIALSLGLLTEFWNEVNDFVNQENLALVIKLSESNKPYVMDTLYFCMLNFAIAHEFGHIVHGHLREGKCENGIDEMLCRSNDTDDKDQKMKNWMTQLNEYDADAFAVSIQSCMFLKYWKNDDMQWNLCVFDRMFITNYLCFRTFAEKTGRNFDMYVTKDIAEYDHPHPGIRMYYSCIHYLDWLGRVFGFGENTIKILLSGVHLIVTYEKNVLEKENVKESYFSVAYTEKGAQHVMNLHNEWQEWIDHFNQYAYIPIEKNRSIDSIIFSLNEKGDFINKEEN